MCRCVGAAILRTRCHTRETPGVFFSYPPVRSFRIAEVRLHQNDRAGGPRQVLVPMRAELSCARCTVAYLLLSDLAQSMC
jgi:hypothetical protein